MLCDTGASANFVSKAFAKQTGITVRPVEYSVRLADDKTTEVAGEHRRNLVHPDIDSDLT
jgi:spermidine/putrescine-binding protein